MTLRDVMMEYLGWCPRFSENPKKMESSTKQLLTNIRLRIPNRVLILLILVVGFSLMWVLYFKSPSDVSISDIKITKDNVLIFNVSFDKPLNVTVVGTTASEYNSDHVRVVSDDKCQSGYCLGLEEEQPGPYYPYEIVRGGYDVFLKNVTDFNVFNVSWMEKQSSKAEPEISICNWSGNGTDSVSTVLDPYYRGTQHVIFFDTGLGNATLNQLYNYSVFSSLTEWTRFSIVIDRGRALVAFYVDGVAVGSRAISSGFRGNRFEVNWTG
jgi:hypothetical protein